MHQEDSSLQLRRALAQQLESLRRAGVRQIPKPKASLRQQDGNGSAARSAAAYNSQTAEAAAGSRERPPAVAAAAAHSAPARDLLTQDDVGQGEGLSLAQRREQLDILRQEVSRCTVCADLACTRTQTVFGVGNPQARLCFIGEAPGADEDRQGEPFVGRAGQLLNKILEACQLRRDEVYILNVLKCRPPGNRTPLPEEAANCRPFLDRQLDLIRPEFICCLGACAAQNLLDTRQAIGRLRGRWHNYRGIKVMVTYHPAYLLRNPAAKKDTWQDMQMLLREMGK